MWYSQLYFVMINLFLFSIYPLFSDNLVVHLPTNTEDTSFLYFANPLSQTPSYETSLYNILIEDIHYLTPLKIKECEESLEITAHHKDPLVAFQKKRWQAFNIDQMILPSFQNDLLEIQIFDTKTSTLKFLSPIPISHDSKLDIRAVHKASDALIKLFTKKDSIASKRILFSYQPKPEIEEAKGIWEAEIWEMDYTGKIQSQVTDENHYTITPSFVPDPKHPEEYKFLYVTYKQGQPRIYISQKGVSKGKPLIPLRGNQFLPTLSSKRDKIAFISDAAGKADLFVQLFDKDHLVPIGKPNQVFSFESSVQASPSFNPDGNQIAFVSDKSGTPRIYIISVDEVLQTKKIVEPKLISRKNSDNSAPTWSPDGKKIAYSARTNGVRQIWIYDIEKDEERQLTIQGQDKENPSWAPDNMHIVYNTTSPTSDIYLLSLNDLNPKRLTNSPGIKHYPVFEP